MSTAGSNELHIWPASVGHICNLLSQREASSNLPSLEKLCKVDLVGSTHLLDACFVLSIELISLRVSVCVLEMESLASYGCRKPGCKYYFDTATNTIPASGFCHPGHAAVHYYLAHQFVPGCCPPKKDPEILAIAKVLMGRASSKHKTTHRLPQTAMIPVTKHARTLMCADYDKVSSVFWCARQMHIWCYGGGHRTLLTVRRYLQVQVWICTSCTQGSGLLHLAYSDENAKNRHQRETGHDCMVIESLHKLNPDILPLTLLYHARSYST